MGGRRMQRVPATVSMLLLTACAGAAPTSSPAAVVAEVAGTAITQTQFDIRLQSTLTSIEQGGGSTNVPGMQTSVRANVLRSLILDTVIAQEAARLGLAATDQQVQNEVNADAQSAGGMSALQTELAGAGGSIAQLEDEIRSSLNEQRVEDHFAQERAAQAELQLQRGTPFQSVAEAVSDDSNTASKGGDLGALSAATLAGDDPVFAAAVKALKVGEYTRTPVHDQGGYDILMLQAASPGSWSVRHILIAAPTPYTVTSRPNWFTEALFSTVEMLCSQGQIHVYISDAGADPCSAASPSPATSVAPSSATPAP